MAYNRNGLDFISMAKDQLSAYIKEDMIDDLVKSELIEYEKKIRPLIQEQVNKITLQGISNFREMLELRDEYRVYMNWDDDEQIVRN